MIRLYAALFVAGALALAGGLGLRAAYRAGYDACGAERAIALERARDDAARAADLASQKEADRLAAQQEADRLAAEMEDQANAEPVRVPECMSADRVRRLNLR